MRVPTVLASLIAMLVLVVAPARAQTQPPPAAPGAAAPPPATPAPEKSMPMEVSGTVKKVDAAAKSVQVSSGLLGFFGATLEVTDKTKINVQGKGGSISDIREGAKVQASYESRDGKNIAKLIEVMPVEEKPATGSGAPARPAPPAGTPRTPSTTPGSTQPKTP